VNIGRQFYHDDNFYNYYNNYYLYYFFPVLSAGPS